MIRLFVCCTCCTCIKFAFDILDEYLEMVAEDRLGLVIDDDDEEEFEEGNIFYKPDSLIQQHPSHGLLYLASVSAAIGGVIFGYDVGVIAGARSQVAEEMALTCTQEELLVSLMPLGAVSSSLVSGRLMDGLGRRVTIQLTCLVFLAGSGLMSLSSGLGLLLLGRFLVGAGVSLSAISESCYISEIATAANRGRLVSLNELGITIGFLLAFIVDYTFMDMTSGWRLMFGLSGGMAAIQLVLISFMPETPHFLVLSGRDLKAIAVMKKIHNIGGVLAQREVDKIKAEQKLERDHSCSFVCSSEDNMRSRLMVGLGLVIGQQLSGQPNVMTYAGDIAQAVGFCGSTLSALATIILGVVKVIATLASLLLVDRLGRRTLLLMGVATIGVSLAVLTVTATYQEVHEGVAHQACREYQNVSETESVSMSAECPPSPLPRHASIISFIALVTYITAYSVSFGPISWILLSELFPLGVKARAMSLGQAVNWTANVVVSFTFLDMVHTFRLPSVFGFYLVMSGVSFFFIYYYVPETKNRTLEEINRELRQDRNTRHKTLSPLPAVKRSTAITQQISMPLQVIQT